LFLQSTIRKSKPQHIFTSKILGIPETAAAVSQNELWFFDSTRD